MVAADVADPRFGVRLARYLAHAGVASRRAAERLIAEGRVTLAGQTVTDPARDVQAGEELAVDGRPLDGPEERLAYVLNKPAGVISTATDTHGRPTVTGLLQGIGARLYPVGRLDAETTGLILLTNDGDLANLLTHPRYEVPKTYRARVGGGPVGASALARLHAGVMLDDGLTAPAEARLIASDTIELTIREGRNRQVRRMCEAIGHPVRELTRTAFGPLTVGDLAPGGHRQLTAAELAALRASARQ